MKSFINSLICASTLTFAANASAAIVSLDFTSIAMELGSSTTYSSAGDSWRATNVRTDAPNTVDAVFTITGTTGTTTANVRFVNNESARGNNMRVRIGDAPSVTNAAVFITIRFVDFGTNNTYTGWTVGEQLITQFSDLDSDATFNRSDFAGARTADFEEARTSDNLQAGSSLLDLIEGPAYAPDYTVGILEVPWTPQGNVTDTSAAAQSPVTAAFLFNAQSEIDIVLGQRSEGGSSGNRHIDIDMTPDFTIIPEPTTALLGSLGMLILLRRRR